jgi:hypothetical protein
VVYFHDAEFSGGEVDFRSARFSGGDDRFRLASSPAAKSNSREPG